MKTKTSKSFITECVNNLRDGKIVTVFFRNQIKLIKERLDENFEQIILVHEEDLNYKIRLEYVYD